jgi:3-oxoadipate enol-lactonase
VIAPTLVTAAPLAHLRWGAAGPWIMLLHGIGGGRGGWDATGAALAGSGCRVLAVDLPGYGASPPVEPFDLAGLAAAVLRLLDAVDAERAVLVGHSMGGMIAQELAARSPGRVQALVLVGTSPAFGRPDGQWQREFLRARFAPLDAGLGMAGLAAQLVPTLVAPDLSADRLAAAQALMAGVPESTYRRALAALVGFDRRADLAAIAVSTLVVTGEHDRTAPPEVARRMAAKIPDSECRVVAGAGHLLPLEQPEAFAALLLDFLRQHLPPDRS